MFEFIVAVIKEGDLLIRYQLKGYPVGYLAHDEDVTDLTDNEIREIVASLIGARSQKDIIEVIFE